MKLIKEYGFNLGGQMMVGLPGATALDEIKTALFIVSSGCDEARIYPTVVFKDTELCSMSETRQYKALSVAEAVSRSADVFEIFVRGGVKVLRIGLCDSENLHNDKTYYDGPNHPAMGEMVISAYYFKKLSEKLKYLEKKGSYKLIAEGPLGHTSKIIGNKAENKKKLYDLFGIKKFIVKENSDVAPFNFGEMFIERI